MTRVDFVRYVGVRWVGLMRRCVSGRKSVAHNRNRNGYRAYLGGVGDAGVALGGLLDVAGEEDGVGVELRLVRAEAVLPEHVRVDVVLLERHQRVGQLLRILLPVVAHEVLVVVEVVLEDDPVPRQPLHQLSLEKEVVVVVGR